MMLYLLFSSDFVYCLVRFCVCYILILCRHSLIFNAFPSVLVFDPDLLFFYRFMSFEHRYTTVAFILGLGQVQTIAVSLNVLIVPNLHPYLKQ